MTSDAISHATHAYTMVDPAGWVGLYRFLPIYAGLSFCVIGAVLLAWGSSPKTVWLLTVPLGALVGKLAVPAFLAQLQMKPPLGDYSWAPSALLALIGLITPPGLFFLAVGLPMGLLGSQLAGHPDSLIGLAGGFFIAGGSAMLLWRRLAALLSAALGAWLMVLGLLSGLHAFLPFLGSLALKAPWGAIAVAGVLALVGASYQLSRPSDEERGKRKADKENDRRRKLEKTAMDRKWGTRG